VQWTIMPLTKLTGTVSLRDVLPAGFQSFLNGRLVFPVGQIPPGGTMTLEYSAIAGQKDGEFKIDSEFLLSPVNQSPSEGAIRSIIEVRKPK
jgi:hypothetical protein